MKRVYIPGGSDRCLNYRNAVMRCGGSLTENTEEADLLILTGGGDVEHWRYGAENTASIGLKPERDEAELALLKQFLQDGKQVLGICRGMQIINVFFGGTLHQDIPGHGQVEDADSFHTSRIAPSLLYDIYGDAVVVNSAHHQAVDRLGDGLQAIQWAEDGTMEAMVHERYPVLAVQWHPERVGETGDQLFRVILSDSDSVKKFKEKME